MKKILTATVLCGALLSGVAFADSNTDAQIDSLSKAISQINKTVTALSKIKVGGYIQTQFQLTDNDGMVNVNGTNVVLPGKTVPGSYSGGAFALGVHQRFLIRRGRVKVVYAGDMTEYALELDATQGGVTIKDLYVKVKEPWWKTASLTVGCMLRPFGFETQYSSSLRESPEPTRMNQTLIPGEHDLGAMVEIAPTSDQMKFLNIKFGAFNGTGNTASENDNSKDIVARVGGKFPMADKDMELDAGVSTLMGKVRNNSNLLYTLSSKSWVKDSSASHFGSYEDRSVIGLDLEYYYKLPIGSGTVRGEYMTGKQGSTQNAYDFYNAAYGAAAVAMYDRKVSGYYVNAIQDIGKQNKFIVKYDMFDPNTDVSGSDIGAAGTNLTYADIAYSTLAVGWMYLWDSNVKFLLYYEMPKNESVNSSAGGTLAAFKSDVKDNVLTLRAQYKF